MGDRESRIETPVPDIPRLAGPTRALVHDRLEGFPLLVVRPRRVEPLLEQPQGTVSRNVTTGLMGLLEECRDTVARHDYPVLMPEIGLVPLPLFLVDQDGFQTLLQAFVDVQSSFKYCTCVSPSRGLIMVMFRSRCASIRLNASLASFSDLAPIMSSKLLRLM